MLLTSGEETVWPGTTSVGTAAPWHWPTGHLPPVRGPGTEEAGSHRHTVLNLWRLMVSVVRIFYPVEYLGPGGRILGGEAVQSPALG